MARTMKTAGGGKAPRKTLPPLITSTPHATKKKRPRKTRKAEDDLVTGKRILAKWFDGKWYKGEVGESAGKKFVVYDGEEEQGIWVDKSLEWTTDESDVEEDQLASDPNDPSYGKWKFSCSCDGKRNEDGSDFCGVWIACDKCGAWGHAECCQALLAKHSIDVTTAGLEAKLKRVVATAEWVCPLCDPPLSPATGAGSSSSSIWTAGKAAQAHPQQQPQTPSCVRIKLAGHELFKCQDKGRGKARAVALAAAHAPAPSWPSASVGSLVSRFVAEQAGAQPSAATPSLAPAPEPTPTPLSTDAPSVVQDGRDRSHAIDIDP